MRLCLTSITLSALLAVYACGGIDFTPTTIDRQLDGITFSEIVFHQDGHAIAYAKPRDWSVSSDGASLRLAPPKIAQAQVTVTQTPLAVPQAFDEATRKQLEQTVLASAPTGAERVTLINEENNPLQIHGQPTFAVTIGYDYYGQDFEASTLYADLGDTRLCVRTIARKADFEKVHRELRGSLFSLSWK